MLAILEHFQSFYLQIAQFILGHHSPNRGLQNPPGIFFESFFVWSLAQAARIAGKVKIHFLIRFIPADLKAVCINNHRVISAINVRRKSRLVFAH